MFLKKKKKSLSSLNQGGGGNDNATTPTSATPPTPRSAPTQPSLLNSPSREYPHGIPTLRPLTQASSSTNAPSPPLPPPRIPKHGRSASQPFPSMLADAEAVEQEVVGRPKEIKGGRGMASKLGFFSSSLPKTSSQQPSRTAEADLITGKCATCDSTVRWPRHVDTFRCNACAMVNDLQYGTIKESPTTPGETATHSGPRLPKRVLPVSIDRTRSLISQCTHAYLRQKVDQVKQVTRATRNPQTDIELAEGLQSPNRAAPRRNQMLDVMTAARPDPRGASRDHGRRGRSGEHDIRETSSFDGGSRPRTAPGQPRLSEDTASFQSKYVYRHFENYLLSCFENCDSLNMSFAIARPPAPVRAASDMSAQQTQQEARKKFDRSDSFDPFTADLDPKMLLLGDIGENARFWLGDGSDHQEALTDEPVPAHPRSRPPNPRKDSGPGPGVERRQPRFNWKAVWDWYQSILLCGRSWRMIRSSFSEEDRRILEDPRIEREIDHTLAEGRHHVQRTLLKATEKLLQHPGRPVKRPEDARFLLILLSNPLLHPHHSHHGGTWSTQQLSESLKSPDTVPSDQAARSMEHAKSAAEAASKGSATGHHSGIIKRMIGLIGNLPAECHTPMIQWLHRMPVPQLRDLVDLVSGFVSYRLTRNAGRVRALSLDPTDGLIPVLSGPSAGHSAHLHAAIGSSSARSRKPQEKDKPKDNAYADDWQVKAAARTMSLLFFANFAHVRGRQQLSDEPADGAHGKNRVVRPGQALPLSEYYNVLLDDADLVADFENWEQKRNRFSFCQYPMFFSIWAKIQLMEHDARRQMQDKARTAFFDSIMTRRVVSQDFVLHVRRDCLVEDSLKEISKSVGGGEEDIKKALKIVFQGEEGVDVGGLRKEWFLLLVREVFDPQHGLFVYDDDSQFCYFNPHTFETSEQYYLVGVVLGLAIYNSTILDISFPPFLFRKLLAAAPPWTGPSIAAPRTQMTYTLDDLAEWRPSLARGLRQLLEFEGDVQETFCRDFVIDVERYGVTTQVPLVHGGDRRAVTNSNRREFVDLYVRHMLDTSVARQFEPFKRGFFTVCSGNALALFRPEEIELLVRGSDEALDVDTLQAVAVYRNWDWARWNVQVPDSAKDILTIAPVPPDLAEQVPLIRWFWESFRGASAKDQRRLLGFLTGSDRIPAMGATSLVIRVSFLGEDSQRLPTARTCFNTIGLYEYESKQQLERKLWMAVGGSEGFGLR